MAEPSQIWRLPAPAALLVGVGLFALPWLEVSCSMGPATDQMAAMLDVPSKDGRIILMTQTGFQAAVGDFTANEKVRKKLNELAAATSTPAPTTASAPAAATPRPEPGKPAASDLLIGLLVACGCGAIFGLLMPVGPGRRALVALCVVSAIAAFALQTLVALPVKQTIDAKRAEIEIPDPAKLPADVGPLEIAETKAAAAKALAELEMVPQARYTPIFFVVWGLLIAGLLAIVVEAYLASEGSGRLTIHRHQFLDS